MGINELKAKILANRRTKTMDVFDEHNYLLDLIDVYYLGKHEGAKAVLIKMEDYGTQRRETKLDKRGDSSGEGT